MILLRPSGLKCLFFVLLSATSGVQTCPTYFAGVRKTAAVAEICCFQGDEVAAFHRLHNLFAATHIELPFHPRHDAFRFPLFLLGR
jgi:hypothetical protein